MNEPVKAHIKFGCGMVMFNFVIEGKFGRGLYLKVLFVFRIWRELMFKGYFISVQFNACSM